MLLPPPKALPIASVRAVSRLAGRDSVNAPMLRTAAKSNGICSHATKLCLDLSAGHWRSVPMDKDTDDLIAQLCTRVGIIMEDSSVAALTVGGLAPEKRNDVIAALEAAADRINALVCAARALACYDR